MHSDDTKRKISIAHQGMKHSPETIEKLKGRKFSDEHRLNLSKAFKGRLISKAQREHISRSLKILFKEGKMMPPCKDPVVAQKMAISKTGKPSKSPTKFKKGDPRISGENNPNWAGGASFKPYGREFNDDLKDLIRKRDVNCVKCGVTEQEVGREHLQVHHVDFDKKNCRPKNLVLLCDKCHLKTLKNKGYWIDYFLTFQEGRACLNT
jgi:hypothetical protein